MIQAMHRHVSVRPLVVATLANYAAQIPYFIHNYYTPQHPLPNLRAVALLGATLIWFLIGLAGFLARRRWGLPLLLSFVTVEAVFYAHTFVTGHVAFQLQNPSDLIRAIFVIGYVSGAVAAIYVFLLIRGRRNGSAPTDTDVASGGRFVNDASDDGRAISAREEARDNDMAQAARAVPRSSTRSTPAARHVPLAAIVLQER